LALVFGLVLGAASIAACGGANESDLFASGRRPTSPDSGGGGRVDAGGDEDPIPEEDAGVDDPRDGGDDPPDGAPQAGIRCESRVCDPGEQVCCGTRGATRVSYACTRESECRQITLACDSDDDCGALGAPGDVCCLEFGTGTSRTRCRGANECLPSQQRYRACTTSRPDVCTGTTSCKQSQTAAPGYTFCLP
jgi:hypothetical protein